jgi:hypothetical protein
MRFAHEKVDTPPLPGCRKKQNRELISSLTENERLTKNRELIGDIRAPIGSFGATAMESHPSASILNLHERIRRSKGRTGRTFSATAKVNRKEMNELEAAAIAQAKGFSEWCRETLLAAARNEVVTPTFTEVVAIRQLLNSALEAIACGEATTRERFQAQLQTIRSTKHRAAAEVMQQYAAMERSR